jgi:hypothetical protein
MRHARFLHDSLTVAALLAAAAACPVLLSAQAPNDLDAFMARVLERRDENWRKLHDYILSETESFAIEGPGHLPLNGFKREYSWYVREGYLIRSPLRYDGVAMPESERRKYEEEWLAREKARDERARSRAKTEPPPSRPPAADQGDVPSLEQLVDQRGEPRFISEAYFLQFRFEPGNYYLAGRERIADREVLKIEYYPTGLFSDRRESRETQTSGQRQDDRAKARDRGQDDEIERQLNKVAQVTLWIDPAEYQIVKYTFDNADFGFLPGRWLVRVGDISASMTMARVLDGIWLPGRISMQADLTFATGRYGFTYSRTFYDYKKAEVGARVRVLGTERK